MKKIITASEIKKILASQNIDQLKQNLKIKKDQDIFKLLLNYLELILNGFDIKYRSLAYKIIGFLEELSVEENTNLIDKCNIMTLQKEKAISLIKEVNKKERTSDKKIVFLKDLANRLENLEINITYNVKSPAILANYNIVKYIIFKVKNINFSKKLIDKNAYLINAFNINRENILFLIVEEYLKAIDDYAKNNNIYNLLYYDEVLESILKEEKIKKDREIIERCIENIIKYDKTKNKNGKEKRKSIYWYKHLIKKLDNPCYEDDITELNNMYGVSFIFNPEIIREGHIKGYKQEFVPIDDSDNDFIITIDDESTYDRDDGISIKKLEDGLYHLKIFIADPNTFCENNDSILLKEAKRRNETLYLPDKIIGLFPDEIVINYLSLDEGKYRLAREYNFLITASGIIEDFYITKKKIIVSKNYSYEEANKLIKKPNSKQILETMENLSEIDNIISKKHIVESSYLKNKTTSEKKIEIYMTFLGNKLAEYCATRGIPLPYRHYVQHANLNNCGINIEELPNSDKKEYTKIIKDIEKINLSAVYSINNKSHEGLQYAYYCQPTSPLRGSADILVNECIDKFYFDRINDKEASAFEEYLQNEIDYLNDKRHKAVKYIEKYNKAKTRSIK